MLKVVFRFILFFLVFSGAAAALTLKAQVPLDTTFNAQAPQRTQIQWAWQAADDAFEMGLSSLAEHFYKKVLLSDALSIQQREEAMLKLVSALIHQQKFEESRNILENYPGLPDGVFYLRQALIAAYMQDWAVAQTTIELVNLGKLSQQDKPWYYIVRGLIAKNKDDPQEAQRQWALALQYAVSQAQQMQFELLVYRELIFAGHVDDAVASKLKKRVEQYSAKKSVYPFVRQYAVVLDKLGKTDEAIDLLEQYIGKISKEDFEEKHQMRLLLGLLAGANTSKGSKALQAVIRNQAPKQYQALALKLLSQSEDDSGQNYFFEAFLNELISKDKEHPLLDELYLLRAQWYLTSRQLSAAESDAKTILEKFPNSPLKASASRLLAYIAWQKDPPQYRIAADYLNKLRLQEESSTQRSRLGVLAADCYFLNGDYENASDLYGLVLKDADPFFPKGPVLFQQVISLLKRGKLDKAQELMDTSEGYTGIDVMNRWRAEWSLINAMKQAGQIDVALERVSELLEEPNVFVFVSLRLRLMWLQAQLLYETGQLERCAKACDAILSELSRVEPAHLTPKQIDRIASQALLLKGKTQIFMGQLDEGLAIWQQLREAYPNSESASISFLEESRYYASMGRLVEALQRCLDLVDYNQDSRYASIALFEASYLAELRGQTNSLEYAIKLLERLIIEYPKSDLKFYARLKQADLLALLNKFSDAQLLYKQLLSEFPNHPDRPVLELNYAKSLHAQALQVDSYFPQAIGAFETLYFLKTLPIDIRVEAGFHRAFAIYQSEGAEAALAAYWMVISEFLQNDDNAFTLSYKGRYWMARTVFELGLILELKNEYNEAYAVYDLIIKNNLPGKALAESKMESVINSE